MKRGKSTGKPTKAEQARLDAIHAMPCICCVRSQPFPTEAHHIVDKGYRKHSGGHSATIPLCGWHHRGELTEGFYSLGMENLHGPWLKQRAKFREAYGTERELLEIVDAKLIEKGLLVVPKS